MIHGLKETPHLAKLYVISIRRHLVEEPPEKKDLVISLLQFFFCIWYYTRML